MGELLLLALAATGTALATGLGAVPVFALGERAAALRPLLWGLAAGLMGVASVVGLLEPALDEGSAAVVLGGLLAGGLFLIASRRALEGRDVHVGKLRGAGVRRSILVLGVLFVHSLPEGFAIGTAFASERDGLGLFILLAIALQNVPEGTASAIPMQQAGFPAWQQFWAAVATSAPAAAGRRRRLPARRADPGAAPVLVRIRRGRDARARRPRAGAAGVHGRGRGAPRSPARRPAPWRCWP